MPDNVQPNGSAEAVGKYTCTRCGWKWTPRSNSLDAPRACARCRSAYWQTEPTSARGNTPENPKWQGQRDLAEERKQARRLARLRSSALELGFRLVPIDNPSARAQVVERQRPVGVPPHSVRFAELEPTPSPAPATPAWRKSW
jgi:hypothetical protein